jgi:hypothetical protein
MTGNTTTVKTGDDPSISGFTDRTEVPSLAEYREIVAKAREQLPPSRWQTTAEAMECLREGDTD